MTSEYQIGKPEFEYWNNKSTVFGCFQHLGVWYSDLYCIWNSKKNVRSKKRVKYPITNFMEEHFY